MYFTIAILTVAIVLAMGRKWELRFAHYLPWSALMAAVACGVAWLLLSIWPELPAGLVVPLGVGAGLVCSLGVILYFFFRDPERTPPHDAGCIVSPADGRIVYVKDISAGRFPFAVKGIDVIPLREFTSTDLIPERGLQIGIAMNFLNVHVNRSPIAGTVDMVQRIPGTFASLKHLASLLENERVLMVFRGQGLQVGIVMIASRLVRRIVSYVDVGTQVPQGQRVGMIRFGSQVDLLVPARDDLQVAVKVGDEVTAGETPLIRFEPPRHPMADETLLNATTEQATSMELEK